MRTGRITLNKLWRCHILISTLMPFCRTLDLSDIKDRAESDASAMDLSPAQLPPEASQEMQAIVSELPFELLNPSGVTDDGHLLAGDIVVNEKQWQLLHSHTMDGKLKGDSEESQSPRKAIQLDRYLWPTDAVTGFPTVYVTFDGSVSRKSFIRSVIRTWESETCVDFREIFDGNFSIPHIRIQQGEGCWSYVGMTGKHGQAISIGQACYKEGIILHEIGHVLGLFHEQSRSDRSGYIRVNYANVKAGSEINFFKEATNNYDIPFDYGSVMHYGSTSFSKNGKPTISTLSPDKQVLIGQRKRLSFRDISIVNEMYNCKEMWRSSCGASTTCSNGGYLGKSCTCVCPPGTSGDLCENVVDSYYATPTCGGNITIAEDGTIITTPNYPDNYPADSGCVWWIQSDDECRRPAITVLDFELFVRMGNEQCALDRLEIRTDNILYGEEYCHRDLRAGTTIEAKGQDLILIFTSKLNWRRGFKFRVNFLDLCITCSAETRHNSLVWESPLYPALYPNNQECSLQVAPATPKLTYLVYNNVNLPRNCHDYISVGSAYDSVRKICGTQSGSKKLFGSYHSAYFKSDATTGVQGWSVSFQERSSSCHKAIYLPNWRSRGALTSPSHPRKHPKYALCEWWITAPPGRRVRLTFRVLRLATSAYFPRNKWFRRRFYQKRCYSGYVLVSLQGDPYYKRSSRTYRLCGYRNNNFKMTSDSNKISLLFYGGSAATTGMRVIYSVV